LKLDDIWENLVLGVIGETIDINDNLTGIRIVDKSRQGYSMHGIEIWLKAKDENTNNEILHRLQEIIQDGDSKKMAISFTWKSH